MKRRIAALTLTGLMSIGIGMATAAPADAAPAKPKSNFSSNF